MQDANGDVWIRDFNDVLWTAKWTQKEVRFNCFWRLFGYKDHAVYCLKLRQKGGDWVRTKVCVSALRFAAPRRHAVDSPYFLDFAIWPTERVIECVNRDYARFGPFD